MSLSRSASRSRMGSMSTGRWLFVIVGFLLFLAVVFVLFIRSVNAGYRVEESQAIAVAKSQGGLHTIDAVVQYTWDEPIWVVRGRDPDNTTWFVWQRKDGLVKQKESDGYSESRIRDRFAEDRPAAKPIRIVPGWLAGNPVWEIRYRDGSAGSETQAIAFYSFKDGAMLKRYDLPGY